MPVTPPIGPPQPPRQLQDGATAAGLIWPGEATGIGRAQVSGTKIPGSRTLGTNSSFASLRRPTRKAYAVGIRTLPCFVPVVPPSHSGPPLVPIPPIPRSGLWMDLREYRIMYPYGVVVCVYVCMYSHRGHRSSGFPSVPLLLSPLEVLHPHLVVSFPVQLYWPVCLEAGAEWAPLRGTHLPRDISHPPTGTGSRCPSGTTWLNGGLPDLNDGERSTTPFTRCQ